jgi:hypothetical protein
MKASSQWLQRIVLVSVVVAISVITALGQLPIPVQGQRGGQGQGQRGQGGQGGQGQRGQQAAQPQDPPPVVSPIASVSAEITGPGKFFETLMELKPGDNLAHFKYVTNEYFVSGTANGQPYKTRIVIRRPQDNSKFSGLVLAESMKSSPAPRRGSPSSTPNATRSSQPRTDKPTRSLRRWER